MEIEKIKNRTPFRLPAGQRLRARSRTLISMFRQPFLILREPTFSELIVLSNENADIALKEAPSNPGKVSAIVVSMGRAMKFVSGALRKWPSTA